jgi:hypothetical protein
VLEMTTQQLNLLAEISIAACWGAVALAWLAGAIYYQSREPAERTRVSYLSPVLITTVIMVVSAAVPRADWLRLEVHAPGIRLLGLAILLAATVLTVWARLALGAMWTAAPTVKQEHQLRTSGPYAITGHPIYTGLLGMLLGSGLLAGPGGGSCTSLSTLFCCSSRSTPKNGSCWPSSLRTTRAIASGFRNWYLACV